MKNVFLVGIGGMLGSIMRYLLTLWTFKKFNYPVFPIGTLLVNIIGCIIIGFLGGIAETRLSFNPEFRIFIFIGILGGFTTFSSFGYDTLGLFNDGFFGLTALNILLHFTVCLFGVWGGYHLAKLLS